MLFAGCAAGRAKLTSRVEILLAASDEGRLRSLLDRLQLVEHVGGRIVAAAGEERFPRLALAAWGSTVAARTRGEVQAVVQFAALERLARAGIRAAPIKGPDLALRVYGDLGLRPCADVDIVVDPERLDDAVAVLRTLGYEGPPAGSPWLTDLHRGLAHPLAAMPALEVHWRTEWYSANASSGGLARTALQRAVPDGRGRRLRFRPADELALLLLVYARDGMPGLRLPADIAAWWDRYGRELQLGALQDIVDADPRLAVPLATAAATCGGLVGLPSQRLLDLGPARTSRGRLARSLASPFLDERRKHSAAPLVDGLLGGRTALATFVRRRLLLSTGRVNAMYERPRSPGGRARVRILQAQHPIRQLVYFVGHVGSRPPRPPDVEWGWD